ncbi:MAG TPA: acetyl-CoA carboxylase, carboxyltransferase subunit beta [Roseiflexaceae bacterium]|nr:acetyl-CoA carboxylase, carboxyltransferase subunit beta [Roseiflexaceae bacterium]
MKDLFRRGPKRFTPAARNNGQHIPDNMWVKCPSCGDLTYVKQLSDNLKVCKCGYHMRLGAREWLGLLDAGSFVEEDGGLAPLDPLEFVSTKDNYAQKLRESQEQTGLYDALVTGRGAIGGQPLQIAVSEFDFIGGSMGSVFGEKLARAAERAAERGVPLLTITATGGARQHEGVFSLMQMAKVNVALTRLADARQPHIALLVDPCYAGVLASYASVADVIIAEPGARVGFAGRRVIEQTIRQKLPPNFQTAEFLLEHGLVDMVVPRAELRATIGKLLRLYDRAPESAVHAFEDTAALKA